MNPNNPFSNFQNFANYQQSALNEEIRQRNSQLQELLNQWQVNGGRPSTGPAIGQRTAPRFGSLAELNAALEARRKAQIRAAPKPVDKPARIKEIERELDIIRGVVPTPKGYTIDKTKIRSLLKELKELQA